MRAKSNIKEALNPQLNNYLNDQFSTQQPSRQPHMQNQGGIVAVGGGMGGQQQATGQMRAVANQSPLYQQL